MIPVLIITFVFVIIMALPRCFGQLISVEPSGVSMADSMRRELKTAPYFSLYKDNYFIVGTSLSETPTKHNSDAKFQVSLAFRLTTASLPWDTYLSLIYTQVAFWNIFEDSFPMRDINFNPGIAWTKPYYYGDRYLGSTSLIIEHESNGRDGEASRSWNRVSFSGNLYVTERVRVFGKIWIPIVDGHNNRDLAEYKGIFCLGTEIQTANKKLTVGFTIEKRKGFRQFNTIAEISWRIHEKTNLSLFAQFYNGCAEGLIDYEHHNTMFRAGIAFKPKFFSPRI